MNGSIVYDIETGPLPADQLELLKPEFDPASVKTGNLKDPEKIAAKIRASHDEHDQRFIDGAALSAATGQVLCIGWMTLGDDKVDIAGPQEGASEVDVLKTWWEIVRMMHGCEMVVGFNSNAFDLPFLVRRSWLLEVDVPDWVMQGRYFHPSFVDLLDVWRLGNRQEYIKLNVLAKSMGLPGKLEGVDGKDFYKVWESDRELAIEYVTQDVRVTAEVAARLQVY